MISGIDPNLLLGIYQARLLQSAARTSSTFATGADRQAFQIQKAIEPPWAPGFDRPSAEQERNRILAGRSVFGPQDPRFAKANSDNKNLFDLWTAVNRLKAVAEHAADKKTPISRLAGIDTKFQAGLREVNDFLVDAEFEKLSFLYGPKTKKVESGAFIPRAESIYETGTIHTGVFDDPVASLNGTERFSLTVDKFGTMTTVNFDLTEVTGVLNLDNLVAYFNGKLTAAGVVTQFERVKVGEPDDSGIILGNNFGLKLQGVSTEIVSFSSIDATPAAYIVGVSGQGEDAAGQIVKLSDLGSADPVAEFTHRLEATGETTTDEDGNVKIDAEALEILDSALDSTGALYVVGTAKGDLGGQVLQSDQDVFLAKYDSTGKLVFKRLLGARDDAAGFAVAVDGGDNVIVAGSVKGDLTKSAIGGGEDSFITKFNAAGVEQFTHQRAPVVNDAAFDIATGPAGEIYIVGKSSGAFSGNVTAQGGVDAYALGLDANGALIYERQFGTTGDDRATAIGVAADGNLVVASIENGNAVVRKLDAANQTAAPIWEVTLGALQFGGLADIAIDGANVYIAGHTANASLDAGGAATVATAHSGGDDGFVFKLTDNGLTASADFISYVGGAEEDRVSSVAASGGAVYVSGQTRSDLDGVLNGSTNAFASKLDAAGTLLWTHQYSGRAGISKAANIVIDPTGASPLDKLGLPTGGAITAIDRSVTANTSVRDGQYFYVAVDGGAKRKIIVEAGDSMRQLAFKVERVLLLNGEADVRRGDKGDLLRIKPAENVKIELIAGDGDFDALKGLGIAPGVLFDDGGFLAQQEQEEETGEEASSTFSLDITAAISLATRDGAEAAAQLLSDALNEIVRAHRDLNTDPALKAILDRNKKASGEVPAHLQSQLANFEAALQRLSSGPPPGAGLFI